MLYPVENKVRAVVSLDGIWEFRFADEDSWRPVYVPASFNNQFTEPKARSYCGIVEYRRSFVVPFCLEGQRRVLRFDSVTHNADVFVDGSPLVSHRGGFLPFEVDISELKPGINHVLLVRVYNRINNHTFPIGNETGTAFFGSDNPGIPSVEHGKSKLQGLNLPNFDFFNYAGINRSVRIYTTPQSFIVDVSLATSIEGSCGMIRYDVHTRGHEGFFLFEVVNAEGRVVASSTDPAGGLRIQDVRTWNPWPGEPYLYTARIHYCDDLYELQFGVRTVEISGLNVLVNGKPFYFKGPGKHEDSPIRGRGVDQCLSLKDINLLHWLNANSFRTSHYPYDETMYQLCDREGILVVDELPAVGLNFGGAKNPYKLGNDEYHRGLLKDLIERDKNHPCVVMWSLGNEPDTEHFPDDAYNYWHSLYLAAHDIDPQSRPVTMVCCQNDYTKDITTRTMDVVCINRYYGWYNLAGNIEVAKSALDEELQFWQRLNKPLILSEYGADAIPGMHSIVPEMFSEEFQVEYLKAMNSILDKYDFIAGEQPWNFADFDTQQGPMRAGGNHKGLFSRDRAPKMAAYYVRERWKTLRLSDQ